MGIHENNIMDEKQIASASSSDKKSWRKPVVEKLDLKIHTQNFLPGPGNDGVQDFVS